MPFVRIELWNRTAALERYRVAPDFGAILRGAALGETMRRNLDDGATIAAAVDDDDVLLGYATVVPSGCLGRRWGGLADVVELGAIEVARSARRRGIAHALLARLEGGRATERSVVIATGLSHHWEPEVAGLPPVRYRAMLVGLLARHGFRVQDTDDPEVLENPLNFLAARSGRKVRALSLLAFLTRLKLDASVVW
jgi:acetoin utilization protein AcuA